MKGKGEIKGWITRNGVHIPIYGNYTVRGGQMEPKVKGAKWKKKRPDNLRAKDIHGQERLIKRKDLEDALTEAKSKAKNATNEHEWRQYEDEAKEIQKALDGKGVSPLVAKNYGKLSTKKKPSMSEEDKTARTVADHYGVSVDKAKEGIASGKYSDDDIKTAKDYKATMKNLEDKRDAGSIAAEDYESARREAIKGFNESRKAKAEEQGKTIEVNGRKINVKPGENNSQAIYRAAMEEQGKPVDKEFYDSQRADYNPDNKSEHNTLEPGTAEKNFKEGLKKHSKIQEMAEAHNDKVWNRPGGARNGELYDEADKFADSQHFDRAKIRDAAFSAFTEKWAATQKERAEQKEQESSTPDYIKSSNMDGQELKIPRKTYEDRLATLKKTKEEMLKKPGQNPNTLNKYDQMIKQTEESLRTGVDAEYPPKSTKESSASDLHSRIQAQAEQADVHRQRTSVKKVQSPITPKLVAPTEEMKRELGIDKDYGYHNLSAAKEAQARYKKSANWAKQKDLRYAKMAQEEKAKAQSIADAISGATGIANSGSIQNMSPSGLKSAYAEATGARKTKLANELRKRGYTYVGRKWVKGRKE